ncbi:type II secretion system F family protein [Aquibacillus salsiterrae]|uniref:Type II secretion system F family protein n=1 Tax=Aquibacillus salsiterrae TaxID=2950439 RepID=A0A9X3WDD5_9BACI|nr:type II secretion system F family protein [Aquibacillus salsiterrae]MDC3416938.1 type II secretion system F family protein [Aquibacillus salsiterrae]
MIVLLYSLTLLLFCFGLFVGAVEKRKRIQNRVMSVLQAEGNLSNELEPEKQPFSKRVIQPLSKRIRKNYQQHLSSEQKAAIELKLLQAGNPLGMTPVEFRMVQLLLFIVLPLGMFGLGFIGQFPIGLTIIFVIFSMILARFLPLFYLNGKIKERNRKVLKELPDFLDLVTVSIEAGLGFDGALSKVVAKKDGVLSKEFQRCLEEMRLGKTRRAALTGVKDRLVLDDIRSLIGSIIQAEQLGIGMVQVMRVQSNEIRQRRKQRAEEAAMKAPIKMLFPLIMFIFPCIFIVLLGPAVIRFLDFF